MYRFFPLSRSSQPPATRSSSLNSPVAFSVSSTLPLYHPSQQFRFDPFSLSFNRVLFYFVFLFLGEGMYRCPLVVCHVCIEEVIFFLSFPNVSAIGGVFKLFFFSWRIYFFGETPLFPGIENGSTMELQFIKGQKNNNNDMQIDLITLQRFSCLLGRSEAAERAVSSFEPVIVCGSGWNRARRCSTGTQTKR